MLLNLLVKGLVMTGRKVCTLLVLCHRTSLSSKWCLMTLQNGIYLCHCFIQYFGIGIILLQNLHCCSLICGSDIGSPGGSGSPSGPTKRSKRTFQSKTFNVDISYSAKIPLKSVALALRGADVDVNAQDALRVLDIVLRQQAANRYLCLFICGIYFHFTLF